MKIVELSREMYWIFHRNGIRGRVLFLLGYLIKRAQWIKHSISYPMQPFHEYQMQILSAIKFRFLVWASRQAYSCIIYASVLSYYECFLYITIIPSGPKIRTFLNCKHVSLCGLEWNSYTMCSIYLIYVYKGIFNSGDSLQRQIFSILMSNICLLTFILT
jgi:hypothetical protein